MLKNFLNYLLRMSMDSAELKKIEHAVFVSNQRSLLVFPLISAVFFGIAACLGYFFGIPSMSESVTAYAITSAANVIVIIGRKFEVARRQLVHHILIMIFFCSLYGFGIYQCIFIRPTAQPLILTVFLCVLPMFFIERPYRILTGSAIASIAYIILSSEFKPEGIAGIDVVDVLIFCIIGVIIGSFNNKLKYERFIFENQINIFRSEEKQTKYWKTVSEIYLSMIQVDLETGLFVTIRSNTITQSASKADNTRFSRKIIPLVKANVDSEYIDEIIDFVNTKTLRKRLDGKQSITHEYIDKNHGWCRMRFIVVDTYKDNTPRHVLFLVENINEQKNKEQTLTTMAETDEMTKLFNRRAGVPKITQVLNEKTPGMLCLLDIDKFKTVNDKYGHQAGDAAIIAVANAMRKTFRDQDILLRLGGDEFLAFASNVTSERTAVKIFTRLFAALDETVLKEAPDYKISVSIGATFGKGMNSFTNLYKQADCCAYESKNIEGKAFTFYKNQGATSTP